MASRSNPTGSQGTSGPKRMTKNEVNQQKDRVELRNSRLKERQENARKQEAIRKEKERDAEKRRQMSEAANAKRKSESQKLAGRYANLARPKNPPA